MKLCSRNEAKKSIQRHPIIMTDADYDYIMDEIERHEKTNFERNVTEYRIVYRTRVLYDYTILSLGLYSISLNVRIT